MILDARRSVASLAAVVLAASCGGGADTPTFDASPFDARTPDAATPDAGFPAGATNPAVLWLAPINRSEINLQLLDAEPPHF